MVNHAHAQGLTIIARLGLTPDWARPPDTPLTYLDEEAYDDFAAFAAAFAERYQGKVDYLVIGNEPNLSYEWGYQTCNGRRLCESAQESSIRRSKKPIPTCKFWPARWRRRWNRKARPGD